MRKLLILLFAFSLSPAIAQVKVTISAPSQAGEGEVIRVSYKVNTADVDDIQVGDFPGFDVLYGPSTSQQNSFSMVNGKTSRSSSVTFTYTLQANKKGVFKLPAATVIVSGKSYRSNTASISIGAGRSSSSPSQNNQSSSRLHTPNAGSKVSGKDLYITVSASKHRVYEQEAVVLTYKLYTLVSIDQCTGKMPDLDGFHTQEIQLPQQKSLTMENVNGRNYGTVIWSKYVLFPQKTGRLTVPSITFTADVVQQNRNLDPFDAFFGGSSMVHVQKEIVAPAVELEVIPLPEKPANFSGAVGTGFTVSASLTPQQVDANDAVQLRMVVSGSGNMKLMNAPEVHWPKDFETYDPKTEDKTTIGSNGASGNFIYDYTAVPRHPGKYTIPPVELCYFDTQSNAYKTLRTDSFQLTVNKGVGHRSSASQEDLKILNSDIRYIMTGSHGKFQRGVTFFATTSYWMLYAIILAVFIALVALFRHQAKANSNFAIRKERKAGKAATKRLKLAAKLMGDGKAEPFYDEVLHALWGYVSDKLHLPLSELTKDNIGEQLQQRGISDELISFFSKVLEDCEFARFAPGDATATMDNLYSDASEVINQLDAKL